MKWLLFDSAVLILIFQTFCQDIVFPREEEMPYLSGNHPVITDRIPVSIPNRCPHNMLLYPGDGNKSVWICDCKPKFLYFPLNNSCYEAYKQGPCSPQNYVILPEGEAVPKCVKNPCLKDGLVLYNNTCYKLGTAGGPCALDEMLSVNETTFQVECMTMNVEPFKATDPPSTTQCPIGYHRDLNNICKKAIS